MYPIADTYIGRNSTRNLTLRELLLILYNFPPALVSLSIYSQNKEISPAFIYLQNLDQLYINSMSFFFTLQFLLPLNNVTKQCKSYEHNNVIVF